MSGLKGYRDDTRMHYGKTAIMEQWQGNVRLDWFSYTMTHHTQTECNWVPVVETRNFDGQEYTVTEYTMSEIIASVYGLWSVLDIEKVFCF